MTILDTPKEFYQEELVDYLRHIIQGIDTENVSISDMNWSVKELDFPLAKVEINITLKQMIFGIERKRVSDNKP